MKVIFSHGKESGPWGFKIKRLSLIAQDLGCHVESIDYTDIMGPDLRVDRLRTFLNNETESFVLVDSSMGDYVSLVVSESVDVKAVFLTLSATVKSLIVVCQVFLLASFFRPYFAD